MIDPVNIDHGRYRKFSFKLGKNYHCGHDFDCPKGTIVKSISKGVVSFIGQANGFGGWKPSKKGGVVMIKHGTIIALYGHVKYNDNIKTGNVINEGDEIGTIDDYFSNGDNLPHLHFCIYTGKNIFSTKWGYVKTLNDWINPLLYLRGAYK
jgi:murein DD-endopeptidase MepM/ murein hydrolase activator NlpD